MNKTLTLVPRAALLVALLFCPVLASLALAQSSTSFDLSWHVLGGGGHGMSSATYAMEGTFGQVMVEEAESEHYGLAGGFWDPRLGEQHMVYLPLVLRVQP